MPIHLELKKRTDKGVEFNNRNPNRNCPELFDSRQQTGGSGKDAKTRIFMLQHEFRAITVTQVETEAPKNVLDIGGRPQPAGSNIIQMLWMYCIHCRRMTAPSYAEALDADSSDSDSDSDNTTSGGNGGSGDDGKRGA